MAYQISAFNDYKSNSDTTNPLLTGGSGEKNDEPNSTGYPVSKLIHGGNTEKIKRFNNLVVPAGLVLERYPLLPKISSSKISGGGNKKLAIFEDSEYHMEPIENDRFERLFASVQKDANRK